MRQNLLLILVLIWGSHISLAQCTNTLTVQTMMSCQTPNNQNTVLAYGASTCAQASSFLLHWTLSNGNTGSQPILNSSFEFNIPIVPGVTNICVVFDALDANQQVIASQEVCQPIIQSPPMILTTDIIQPASGCGINNGCVAINVTGGIPPYTYYLGGNGSSGTTMNMVNSLCNLAPGGYYVLVTDNSGCNMGTQFIMPQGSPTGIIGAVFNDLNSNGAQGTGTFAEDGIGNQPVYIVEADITVYTNSEGYFEVPDLPAGTYTVEWIGSDANWTSDGPVTVQAPGCVNVPLESTEEILSQSSGLANWSNTLHCQNGLNTGIWIANSGNTPLSGTLTMTSPTSLTFSQANSGIAYTSTTPGEVVWDINGQLPGTSSSYLVHINGPGVGFVGQSYPLTFHLVIEDGQGGIFYENTWTRDPVVTCAYDPNDKTAFPEGYAEPHFILADTELTYRIRFQNTGNAAAERVEIVDQLDVAHLDLSTFKPLAASHSFATQVNPDGEVHFVFDPIHLPDSLSDPEGSQGFVIYQISPKSSIQPGDIIENTAEIYFDLNPAIVTNTTHHTIFDCAMLPLLSGTEEYCYGDYIVSDGTTDYVDSYAWTYNDLEVSTDPILYIAAEEEGEFELNLRLTNPLCSVEGTQMVTVHPLPEVSIEMEEGVLVATPSMGSFTWFLDGYIIEDANGPVLEPTTGGSYMVGVLTAEGCYGQSETLTVVGVEEQAELNRISVYPNPVQDISRIQLSEGHWNLTLMDSGGRIVKEWKGIQGQALIDQREFAPGYYVIQARHTEGYFRALPVLMK